MKEIKIFCIFLLWVILLVVCLSLAGCKTPEPSTQIGENLQEQIQLAYNNLPKECKSPEREKEFNLAVKNVESLTATCELEKVPLRDEIRYLRTLLIGAAGVSLLLFLGLLRKYLVR